MKVTENVLNIWIALKDVFSFRTLRLKAENIGNFEKQSYFSHALAYVTTCSIFSKFQNLSFDIWHLINIFYSRIRSGFYFLLKNPIRDASAKISSVLIPTFSRPLRADSANRSSAEIFVEFSLDSNFKYGQFNIILTNKTSNRF